MEGFGFFISVIWVPLLAPCLVAIFTIWIKDRYKHK